MDSAKIAFQGEVMLAGVTWSHTQGGKLAFWVDEEGFEAFKHMTCKKGNQAGQRFAVVFVEIGADEKPVTQALSNQAALHCKSLGFQQFVESRLGYQVEDAKAREMTARAFILTRCGINSRSELDTNGQAAIAWRQILAEYREWSEG